MSDMRHVNWSDKNLEDAKARDKAKEAEEKKVLFSSCCGVEDGLADINGPDWSTLGMCPKCKEHCEFVGEDDEEA